MFAYCLNNPINRTDVCGTNSITLSGELLIGISWLPLIDGPLPIGDIIFFALLMNLLSHIQNASNESDLPNQGEVSEIPDAPAVDAGKQGKHVPGHPNNDPSRSQWNEGETGVKETQEAWINGENRKQDGSVRVGTASDGRRIKVHMDKKGRIHGYPIPWD